MLTLPKTKKAEYSPAMSDACRGEPLLLQLTAWLQQQDLHQEADEGLTIEV